MNHHFLPEETYAARSPEELGLKYGAARRLPRAENTALQSGDCELCLFLMAGQVDYHCGDQAGEMAVRDMLYVPIDTEITLNTQNGDVFLFSAPCTKAYPFAHIRFADVDASPRHVVYGQEALGTKRDVWNMIDDTFPAGRFLTGLCQGRDGGWTAWPPHEHGAEREEIYLYYGMGDGFAVQCVYGEDMDDPYTVALVRDGHLVTIDKGYHPNCGSPKGGISYMFCMVSTTEGDREFMNLRTQKIFGDRLA